MELYQKIHIEKDGNSKSITYENNNSKFYRQLNDDEFITCLNKSNLILNSHYLIKLYHVS